MSEQSMTSSIQTYISHKRALGRKFSTEERQLRFFDRCLREGGIQRPSEVTPEAIEAFFELSARSTGKSFNNLLGHIRRFFDWLVCHDLLDRSPVRLKCRSETDKRLPFIVDANFVRSLLEHVVQLPDQPRTELRGPTYHACFAVMFGLGLRAGEVARLRRCDLDDGRRLLVVRQSKFGKSRLVPFGPKIAKMLADYLELRHEKQGPLQPDTPLFSINGSKPIHVNRFNKIFQNAIAQFQVEVPAGTMPPVVHHLRHSFAVARLLRWYREGINPSDRLLDLATFMGHSDPAATAVYLTITSDILREAAERFEQHCAPSRREVV